MFLAETLQFLQVFSVSDQEDSSTYKGPKVSCHSQMESTAVEVAVVVGMALGATGGQTDSMA